MEDKYNKHFTDCFIHLMAMEGGFSNDPLDRGGRTKFGITEDTAIAWGWHQDIKELPFSIAKLIYKEEYWDALSLDSLCEYSPRIAAELFEAGVNCGPSRSVKWLQETINLLSEEKTIEVDGILGKRTMRALKANRYTIDKETIFRMLNSFQGQHYINICQRDETQKRFLRGWFRRVFGVVL